MTDAAAIRPPRRTLAAFVCVLLAAAFSLHAWLATRGKSATFDEPIHALSSWLIVNRGDFRINPEHPPLWKYLAGLPLVGFPLHVDLDSTASLAPLGSIEREWGWGTDVLYRTPGNDGVALVARARMAMAVLPMLLALVVARWAWQLAGPTAAVVATGLVTLDPNLLAHGALVTNDVAATLVITLAAGLTWRLGQRVTWPRAVAWVVVCALAVGVKFTCVLLAPMLGAPLIYWIVVGRAFPPVIPPPARPSFPEEPMRGGGQTGRNACPTRMRHLAIVAGLGLATIVLAYLALWPMYGGRRAATATGRSFDRAPLAALEAYNTIQAEAIRAGTPMTATQVRAASATVEPPLGSRAVAWLDDRHLVPDALAAGLRFARARSLVRPAFLLERSIPLGSWTYFPLAVAFKTPTATLAITLVAGVAFAPALARAGAAARWTIACLAAPPLIYFAIAMTSGLNIGIRHVLPIFPPLYVALGAAASHAVARWRRAGATVVAGTIGCVAVEVFAAYPNYLAFFNAPSGGPRGGLRLLSDSNLDWGQDLPALADWYRLWRRANPTAPFYLSYFGSVAPHAYGIDSVNAVPGYPFGPTPTDAYVRDGGTLAISATFLQGVNADASLLPMLATLRASAPVDVIDGSIYVYHVAPVDRSPPR